MTLTENVLEKQGRDWRGLGRAMPTKNSHKFYGLHTAREVAKLLGQTGSEFHVKKGTQCNLQNGLEE